MIYRDVLTLLPIYCQYKGMNSKAQKPQQPQDWPYIRFAKTEQKWMVDARTKDGGSRRFFNTKIEAQTFAQQCRVIRDNSGASVFGNEELAHYGKTVHDAIAFYLAHLRQQAKSVSVETASAEIIELKRAAHKSERYVNDLRLRLGRFCRDLGDRSVAGVTSKDLDSWFVGLAVAPGTRNTFRRDVSTLFSFCEKRGYCPTNPAKQTERAEDVDKPPGILTPAQCRALLNACGDDVLPYVAISLFAGLRAAEIEKLNWTEVDLIGLHVEVTAAKSKTKKRRLIPICANLVQWLKSLAKSEGKVVPAGLRKRLDAAKKRAGIKEWPQNAMRHSYGSYRLAVCADAARVSLEMGNSPAMVFAHYRELVRPAEAEKYWTLTPETTRHDATHQSRGVRAR